MTTPRIRLDLGMTIPGPGAEGRYQPIKVSGSVELDLDETFDENLSAAVAAMQQAAPPMQSALLQEAANMSGVTLDESFGSFTKRLKEWQDRVANNLRQLNTRTGLTGPGPEQKDTDEAKREAAIADTAPAKKPRARKPAK